MRTHECANHSTLAKISDLAASPQIQKTLSGYIDLYLAHGGKGLDIPMEKLRAL